MSNNIYCLRYIDEDKQRTLELGTEVLNGIMLKYLI